MPKLPRFAVFLERLVDNEPACVTIHGESTVINDRGDLVVHQCVNRFGERMTIPHNTACFAAGTWLYARQLEE